MKQEAQATFGVDLHDGTSGPAESAARALAGLEASMKKDLQALREMNKAMKLLQGGTQMNIQQFRALKSQIDAKKQAIAQAQGAIIDLGGSFGKTRKGGSDFGKMLDQMRAQAQGVGGPLGGTVGKIANLKSLLAGGAVMLGVLAVAAGFVALGFAAVAATSALLKYGVAQADATRSELLRLEGMTKIRSMWGLVAGNAGEIQAAIDKVSASTAMGRSQVAGYAESLYRAGLRGTNLSEALEATAIKATVQGDAMGKRFASMAAGIALSGGSVKRLADDVRARLGGIAARQLLALDVQAMKLRESFAALFSGLKIEGFLKAMHSITDAFSQNTVSGRALKTLMEVTFQPMISALQFVAPLGQAFFEGMIYSAQFLAIQVLRAGIWLKEAFGVETFGKIDLTNVAIKAGILAVTLLAAGLGVLTVGFAMLMAPIAGVAAMFYGFGYAVVSVFDFIGSLKWGEIGTSIVDGITVGLWGRAGALMESVKGLGKQAYDAFKNALGIASPSKEFAKLGIALPQGVEQGIDRGSASLEKTAGEMVTPELPAGSSAATGGGTGGRSGASAPSVTIENITIQASEGTARGIAADIRRELEEVLSGLVVQMGGAT